MIRGERAVDQGFLASQGCIGRKEDVVNTAQWCIRRECVAVCPAARDPAIRVPLAHLVNGFSVRSHVKISTDDTLAAQARADFEQFCHLLCLFLSASHSAEVSGEKPEALSATLNLYAEQAALLAVE
jgi:hypothetical protein